LRSVRWMVVVLLVGSGLQKLVHGYWFRAQFLAWSLWRDSFREVLGPLMPADELSRLMSYGADAGDGPYLVHSVVLVTTSNLVWVAEILLGCLLLFPATRRYAWVAASVLVVGLEVVAREMMFGVEFLAAILLFARTDVVRRFVVPAAIVLAVLVLMRLWVVPEMVFH